MELLYSYEKDFEQLVDALESNLRTPNSDVKSMNRICEDAQNLLKQMEVEVMNYNDAGLKTKVRASELTFRSTIIKRSSTRCAKISGRSSQSD